MTSSAPAPLATQDRPPGATWPLWRPLAAITVLILVVTFPLISGRAVGLWDVDDAYFARFVLWADAIRAGQLVLWDPWTHAGLPAYASPEIGTFSPAALLVAAVTGGTSRGFIAYWLTAWWFGGLGFLLLARHLRAPLWGSLTVALGFVMSGIYTGHAEHTSIIVGFSFLPWIVWRLDDALLRDDTWPAVEAGALWGLSALSGYPALAIITGLFCAAWALGRWWAGGTGSLLHVTRTLVAIVIVGGVVLAPAYYGFFYEGVGPRVEQLSRDQALNTNSLSVGALATFASPSLVNLRLIAGARLWGKTDVSSIGLYMGAPVTVLMLAGIWVRRDDRWRWWLAGLFACSLAAAVGDVLPLRGWLYDWVYPLRLVRHSALFRVYAVFAGAILALLASQDLERRGLDPRRRRALMFASGLCATLAIAAVWITARKAMVPADGLWPGLWLHFALGWGSMCAVALTAMVRPALARLVPQAIVAVAVLDAAVTGVIARPTIYQVKTAAIQRWRDLDAHHVSSLNLLDTGVGRGLRPCAAGPCWQNDQLILKRPVLRAYVESDDALYLRMLTAPRLIAIASGDQRAWFSPGAVKVPLARECLEALVARSTAIGAAPLVVTTPDAIGVHADQRECAAAMAEAPAAERVNQRFTRYDTDHLSLEIDAPSDGWLLVSDRWSRSWRAVVNGRDTPVSRGNFVFRAVPVNRGLNRVDFTFRPTGILLLVAVSWGALAFVTGTSLWRWRRWR